MLVQAHRNTGQNNAEASPAFAEGDIGWTAEAVTHTPACAGRALHPEEAEARGRWAVSWEGSVTLQSPSPRLVSSLPAVLHLEDVPPPLAPTSLRPPASEE